MKTLSNTIILLFLLLAAFACDDMNSVNQEYLDRGETIYTERIDTTSLFLSPGYDRARIQWTLTTDLRVKNTVIAWVKPEDGKDTLLTIPVNRTSSDDFPMEVTLSVPEGNYLFDIYTQDSDGHRSLSVARSLAVYGERYAATLYNRAATVLVAGSRIYITWPDLATDSEIEYTMLYYMDYTDSANPVPNEVRIEKKVGAPTTEIISKKGEEIKIISTWRPSGGLDALTPAPKITIL
jgi:hypothetical protein